MLLEACYIILNTLIGFIGSITIGPYDVNITKSYQCNGNNSKFSKLDIKLIRNPVKNIYDTTQYNFTVIEDVGPVQFKADISKWDEKKKKYVRNFRTKSDNCCEYYMLIGLIQAQGLKFDNSKKSCKALKGNYQVTLNLTSYFHRWLGSKKHYGKEMILFKAFTPKYQIVCLYEEREFIRAK